jgi:phenylacetate-coenzyme A ligase PaaK-like adenylate-forming protein
LRQVLDDERRQGSAREPRRRPRGTRDETIRLHARELLLLQQTLAYAGANVPYYADLFRQLRFDADEFRTVADLRRLPPLQKATIASRLESFLSRRTTVSSIVCTSGTTGLRLPRFVCQEEEEACRLLGQIGSARFAGRAGKRDILLRVFPAMRRYSRLGRNEDLLQITVTLNWDYPRYYTRCDYYDFVIRQLFEPMPVPGTHGRVTVVHVTPPFVARLLAEEIEARSLAFRDTRVHTIVCSGGLLTDRIRRLIEQRWGARAVSAYSMTEANATAAECPVVRHRYHFDAAAFLEVVDPRTQAPVPEGHEGHLLVTTLHPFQQAQPFIRYDTGDVVMNCGVRCECGAVARTVEFRGRREHCLDLGDVVPASASRRFVASADIQNLLEEIPEVPSLLYPRFELKRVNRPDGATVVQMRAEAHHLTGPDMVEALRQRTLTALRSLYPEWDTPIRQGRLAWDIQWSHRGEMESFFRLYPPS